MRYPHQLTETEGELKIYVPDPERIKPVYEQLLAADSTTKFPFWGKIWPSAIGMVSFLKSNPGWITNKQILELGAGIGLPSFFAAPLASGILISDYDPEAILLVQKNIEYLGFKNVRAMQIDWNHFPEHIQADTILLSDINYAPDQFNSLLSLIRNLLDQGTTILLSTPQRITASPFVTALEPFVKTSVLEMVPEHGQLVEIRIVVLINSLT